MTYHFRIEHKGPLAKEFGLDRVLLEVEEPKPEQRFYPNATSDQEKELRFIVMGQDLFYWGHVLIRGGMVQIYSLFPGQEPITPISRATNQGHQDRIRIISTAIEDDLQIEAQLM